MMRLIFLEAVTAYIQIFQEEQGSSPGFLSTRGSSLKFVQFMSDVGGTSYLKMPYRERTFKTCIVFNNAETANTDRQYTQILSNFKKNKFRFYQG